MSFVLYFSALLYVMVIGVCRVSILVFFVDRVCVVVFRCGMFGGVVFVGYGFCFGVGVCLVVGGVLFSLWLRDVSIIFCVLACMGFPGSCVMGMVLMRRVVVVCCILFVRWLLLFVRFWLPERGFLVGVFLGWGRASGCFFGEWWSVLWGCLIWRVGCVLFGVFVVVLFFFLVGVWF